MGVTITMNLLSLIECAQGFALLLFAKSQSIQVPLSLVNRSGGFKLSEAIAIIFKDVL